MKKMEEMILKEGKVLPGGELKVGGLSVPIPDSGRVYFECDGAMSYSMLYMNGKFLGGWPYGYTRWRVDVTGAIKADCENTIAIRCHNIPHSSRWYTGGGLFRECRLLVCPEDHVIPRSVLITTPEVTPKRAKVRVRYEMSKSGKRDNSFYVENPRLWDIDDPHLYSLDIEGDVYRYGIRTIAFHSDERRFQLNGRTVPLNGVSMHHDFGVLGAAWNRAAQRRRLLLFKEAGVNAIRSSHNPPDEGLLEICDELGLSALVETHNEAEVDDALCAGARVIGVNNRNLKDFSVDTENSKRLRKLIPRDILFVAESGVKTAADVRSLRAIGADAVLVGETLMRAADKTQKLNELRGI